MIILEIPRVLGVYGAQGQIQVDSRRELIGIAVVQRAAGQPVAVQHRLNRGDDVLARQECRKLLFGEFPRQEFIHQLLKGMRHARYPACAGRLEQKLIQRLLRAFTREIHAEFGRKRVIDVKSQVMIKSVPLGIIQPPGVGRRI